MKSFQGNISTVFFFSLKEDIDIIFLNIFPISVNGSAFLKLQVVVDLKSFRK